MKSKGSRRRMPRSPEDIGIQLTTHLDQINQGATSMNDNFKNFKSGFIQGAKETPRGFFAPLMVLFRWMDRVTDEVINDTENKCSTAPAQPDRDLSSLPSDAAHRYQAASSAITRAKQALEDARRAAFEMMETEDPRLATLAIHVLGSRDNAICWFLAEPLQAFRGSTAWEVVSQGRAEAVITYLESISSGFVG